MINIVINITYNKWHSKWICTVSLANSKIKQHSFIRSELYFQHNAMLFRIKNTCRKVVYNTAYINALWCFFRCWRQCITNWWPINIIQSVPDAVSSTSESSVFKHLARWCVKDKDNRETKCPNYFWRQTQIITASMLQGHTDSGRVALLHICFSNLTYSFRSVTLVVWEEARGDRLNTVFSIIPVAIVRAENAPLTVASWDLTRAQQ